MPLTALHCLTGAATSATWYVVEQKISEKDIDPEILKMVIASGGIAGALPDILEPPFHRRHRSLYHSLLALGASAIACSKISDSSSLSDHEKTFLRSVLAAYTSHLLLDSRTPMGLPLIL